jgi:hypothetical protein
MHLKRHMHLGRQISHSSVQTKFDSLFKPALLDIQKQAQLLSLQSMYKHAVLLYILNKGSTAKFYNLFSTALFMSLNSPFML